MCVCVCVCVCLCVFVCVCVCLCVCVNGKKYSEHATVITIIIVLRARIHSTHAALTVHTQNRKCLFFINHIVMCHRVIVAFEVYRLHCYT